MQIQPINNQQFQMKYKQRVINNSKYSKKVIDTITLDNGNKLIVSKEYLEDRLMNKLAYLKDKANKWIKSKLTFYNSKGKRSFVKTSRRLNNENKD